MTRYRYYTATSPDGFLADEQHSLDWLFEHSDTGPSTCSCVSTAESDPSWLRSTTDRRAGCAREVGVKRARQQWLSSVPMPVAGDTSFRRAFTGCFGSGGEENSARSAGFAPRMRRDARLISGL
jgi:hypothetical protein